MSYMIRFALGIVAPTLMSLYGFSPQTMGYILSGWNWSYTGALVFVGPIIDRFGPWIVMGTGSVIWGLSTVALPVAGAAVSLFLLRMIFGFGQSALIPANATSISRGFGSKERARAISVAFSGNQVGLVVGAIVAAFLLDRWGWPSVFYCLGGASLLLTVAWVVFYPDKRVGRLPPAKPDGADGLRLRNAFHGFHSSAIARRGASHSARWDISMRSSSLLAGCRDTSSWNAR